MTGPFFASGDIRTATARLAATGKRGRLTRPCIFGKAVSLHEPTAQTAPRMRRNGGVGKRRRVDPGNGKAGSGVSRISYQAAYNKSRDSRTRDAP